MLSSYYMNGPITLFVVVFGVILNGLTICFLFFYTVSKKQALSNTSTVRMNTVSSVTSQLPLANMETKKCRMKSKQRSFDMAYSTKNNLSTIKERIVMKDSTRPTIFKKNSLQQRTELISQNVLNGTGNYFSIHEKECIITSTNSKGAHSFTKAGKSNMSSVHTHRNNRAIKTNFTSLDKSDSPESEIPSNSVASFIMATLRLTTQANPVLNKREKVCLSSPKPKAYNYEKATNKTNTSTGSLARPRVYTFFLWLVISDTTLLVSALLMYSIPTLFDGNLGLYVYFSSFFYLMSNTALTASVWLMCALVFDRYRTIVVHPFVKKCNADHKNKGIHQALLSVYLIALCFSLPRFFELRLEKDFEQDEYFLIQTSIVHNKLYMIGYRILGGLLLYSLFPYVVLFVLSFRVWLVMRESAITRLSMSVKQRPIEGIVTPPIYSTTSSMGRNSLSSQQAKFKILTKNGKKNSEKNLTLNSASDSETILFCVMIKFLFSRLMPTILDVAEHFVGSAEFVDSLTVTMFVDTSNLVVVISSAANFLIFFTFSRSFRDFFNGYFCCSSTTKLNFKAKNNWQRFALLHSKTPNSTVLAETSNVHETFSAPNDFFDVEAGRSVKKTLSTEKLKEKIRCLDRYLETNLDDLSLPTDIAYKAEEYKQSTAKKPSLKQNLKAPTNKRIRRLLHKSLSLSKFDKVNLVDSKIIKSFSENDILIKNYKVS